MKKPEKFDLRISSMKSLHSFWNKCCDEWEEYHKEVVEDICIAHCKELEQIAKDLPSEEEIGVILDENSFDIGGCGVGVNMEEAAKAIHKRLNKECK